MIPADKNDLVLNLGVRTAFRFATVDLYARRLAASDVSDYGIALHTEL